MVFLISVKARSSLAEHRASEARHGKKWGLPLSRIYLSLLLFKGNRYLLSHDVYIARVNRSFRPTLLLR